MPKDSYFILVNFRDVTKIWLRQCLVRQQLLSKSLSLPCQWWAKIWLESISGLSREHNKDWTNRTVYFWSTKSNWMYISPLNLVVICYILVSSVWYISVSSVESWVYIEFTWVCNCFLIKFDIFLPCCTWLIWEFVYFSIQFNSVYYSSYETFIQRHIKETRKNQRVSNRQSTTNKQTNQGPSPSLTYRQLSWPLFRQAMRKDQTHSSRKRRAQLSSVIANSYDRTFGLLSSCK